MALSAGTASVNSSGVASGSGLALAIYQARISAQSPTPDVANKQWFAADSQAIATAVVAHLTASGEVKIVKDAIDTGVPSVDRTFSVA